MIDRALRIRLAWNNPFTEPPDRMPRILFNEIVSESDFKSGIPELEELVQDWGLGKGYGIHWSLAESETPKRKTWSKERKRETRRRNLRKRLEKQYPMFADQMFQRELKNSPSYFDGEDVTKDNLNQ